MTLSTVFIAYITSMLVRLVILTAFIPIDAHDEVELNQVHIVHAPVEPGEQPHLAMP